ncbi:MAG: general secretion pathway protein GspB, partial [Xanthomonadales bacterium]|nr:general secretion pathway protein GspB [Xanthomonadales bacterium]
APAPPPAAAAAASADAGPQLLWALPYAQRRGIPELKLSMHVYAADPAQRFVIINGNRQVEGDEFEGLKLIEIRNDGLVLALGQLRFVYPRGGR